MGCILCIDGLVFDEDAKGSRTVWRCRCALGEKHSIPQCAAGDKEKKKPMTIPVFGSRPQRVDGRERASGKDD